MAGPARKRPGRAVSAQRPGLTRTEPWLWGTPNDQAIARLEHEHPGWECWVVNRVYGGPVWCARPRGAPAAQVHADTAEHLGEYIAEKEEEKHQ